MAEPTAPALYDKLKVSRSKTSEATIEAEVPVAIMERHAAAVFESARREFVLPGFRKGQVPADMFRQHANEMHIWEDAADRALREAFPAIVEAEKLDILGRPEVQITKLAPGNPLAFSMKLALRPEFTLPDYKKIGTAVMAEPEAAEVSDVEVEEAIRQLQLMRHRPADGTAADAPQTLPELTDEEVKKFGPFETVAAFRAKLRENLLEEKQAEARRVKRERIADRLIEKTKFALPELLVAEELEAMREERTRHLTENNLTLEDYLKHLGKTEAQLVADERAYVERQMHTRFIFAAIAAAEHLTAAPQAIEWNVKLLAKRHPDAEPEQLRRYVVSMLVNQQVLDVLEGRPNAATPEAAEDAAAPAVAPATPPTAPAAE